MTSTLDPRPSLPFPSRPALALITFLPLVWLLTATMTAGVEKIRHPDPRVGFLAHAKQLDEQQPGLEQALAAARAGGQADAVAAAAKALQTNRVLHFNDLLDAAVAGVFLVLVTVIVLLSVREWILLLGRRKLAVLRESEAVWLPDYAVAEAKPVRVAGLLALGFALAKELSGEAQLEREQQAAAHCECCCAKGDQPAEETAAQARKAEQRCYVAMTEQRFKGVSRCC